MKKIQLTLSVFIVLVCSNTICAQTKISWNITAGTSLPIGSFAKMDYDHNTGVTDCALFDSDKNGGASIGINAGISALIPLKSDKISAFLSADIHYNGVNSNTKSYLSDICNLLANNWGQSIINGGDHLLSSYCTLDRKPSYFNIPIMIGIHYCSPLSNGMKLFGECGLGLNMIFIQSWKLTGVQKYIFSSYSEDTWLQVNEVFSYESNSAFAFKIGTGLFISDNLFLSVYYYYLGKSDVSCKIESTWSGEYVSPNTSSQYMNLGTVTPSILSVKLGYSF